MEINILVYHKPSGKRYRTATNVQSNGNVLLRSKEGKYYKGHVDYLKKV